MTHFEALALGFGVIAFGACIGILANLDGWCDVIRRWRH